MKKPIQKAKSKVKRKLQRMGSKIRQPKKKSTAIAAPLEFYIVELEVASRAGDGTTQYSYTEYSASQSELSEEKAKELADEMKAMGIGGRIVHLDGTPEGKVISTWGSIERMAAAEKVERASIERKGWT